MIEPSRILKSQVMVGDEVYHIRECQRMDFESKYGYVFTGVVAPPCRGCGGEPAKFRVEIDGPLLMAMDEDQRAAHLVQEIEDAVNVPG